MIINADLHIHSGYSGGVGNISLDRLAVTMRKKGINLIGTGDAMHTRWSTFLKENLKETAPGIFSAGKDRDFSFILQSEIVITLPYGKKRKSVHNILLFPGFDAIQKAIALFTGFEMKNTIGRPFLKLDSPATLAKILFELREMNVHIIPAHILTPDGIFGSKNPVNFLGEFYGDFANEIIAVETGLSADPEIIAMIPELDNVPLVSNSDCHSEALNRVGREFTKIKVEELSFSGIIDAVRNRQIVSTVEFNPSEGRYFLTGHRKGKFGHEEDMVYNPGEYPESGICPVCGRQLTIGVYDRALAIGKAQGRKVFDKSIIRQDYKKLVPLAEVIAYSLGVKNPSSVRVVKIYEDIISEFGCEIDFWYTAKSQRQAILNKMLSIGTINENTILSIEKVIDGDFDFIPNGFDGVYGTLSIGKN